eukprot:jgi/Chrzof1/7694/Cz02g33070.t1
MLAFGLPLTILVVVLWPVCLAALLADCRSQIQQQQNHPQRRRPSLKRLLVSSKQLLGLLAGFYRPNMYLWAAAVECRKLMLIVVLLLLMTKAAIVQLYALWGLLAVMLLMEWWMRPHTTWPLIALQLFSVGLLQTTVYLASAFTQTALVSASAAFVALIALVNVLVVAAFLLSLVPGLRSRWLLQLLDADSDGKISSKDVVQSASKLLWHRQAAPEGKSTAGLTRVVTFRTAVASTAAKFKAAVDHMIPTDNNVVVTHSLPDLDSSEDGDGGDVREAVQPSHAVAGCNDTQPLDSAASGSVDDEHSVATRPRLDLHLAPRTSSEHVALEIPPLAANIAGGNASGVAAFAAAAAGLPLESLMSINKWLEDSGEVGTGGLQADSSMWGTSKRRRHLSATRQPGVGSASSTGSLPVPGRAMLWSASSMPTLRGPAWLQQRQQLLQAVQQWQQEQDQATQQHEVASATTTATSQYPVAAVGYSSDEVASIPTPQTRQPSIRNFEPSTSMTLSGFSSKPLNSGSLRCERSCQPDSPREMHGSCSSTSPDHMAPTAAAVASVVSRTGTAAAAAAVQAATQAALTQAAVSRHRTYYELWRPVAHAIESPPVAATRAASAPAPVAVQSSNPVHGVQNPVFGSRTSTSARHQAYYSLWHTAGASLGDEANPSAGSEPAPVSSSQSASQASGMPTAATDMPVGSATASATSSLAAGAAAASTVQSGSSSSNSSSSALTAPRKSCRPPLPGPRKSVVVPAAPQSSIVAGSAVASSADSTVTRAVSAPAAALDAVALAVAGSGTVTPARHKHYYSMWQNVAASVAASPADGSSSQDFSDVSAVQQHNK